VTEELRIDLQETLRFLRSHAPPPCRLLEVGCGDGLFAELLLREGYRVRAIDPDADAIVIARGRGVDAQCHAIEGYREEPFDVVMFTRSLHHVEDLDQTTASAKELLRPGGALVVDDFSYTAADSAAAAWRYDVEQLLACILADQDCVELADDPLQHWREDHPDHHLHPASALRVALKKRFANLQEASGPYLYRYFVDRLPSGSRGDRLLRALLDWEQALLKRAELPPIGLRFWARR
jgi:SAM-dependent methyltransferase